MVRARETLFEAVGVEVEIGDKKILDGVDLTLSRGELVAVVGPNGAGKSTFARIVCGLLSPTAGKVEWGGVSIERIRGRELAQTRAFIPQRPQVPAGMTVEDAVAIGRSAHFGPFRGRSPDDRDAIGGAISKAGVSRLAGRQLNTLSGGELQRVQIAVALAQDSPALVADEPTAQLDLGATADVSRLLRGLVDQGLAVLLIVHDLALAAAIADRVTVISSGRSIATGSPFEVLTPQLISEVWGVEADLVSRDGRSALHVGWLDRRSEEVD